jgi:hypothetical protein
MAITVSGNCSDNDSGSIGGICKTKLGSLNFILLSSKQSFALSSIGMPKLFTSIS